MTTLPFSAALLTLLAAPLLGASPPSPAFEGQLMFHQHIVIRIPRMPQSRAMTGPDPMPPIEWEEKSGPKCVDADALIAATIPTEDRVDLMMRDGQRIRARLDKKCRALDFYTGFYVQGGSDGQICADRDSIRTRSGDDCGIDKFRRLVAAN